jgi:hypothetical protein
LRYWSRKGGTLCQSKGYFANTDEHHLPEAIDYVGYIQWQAMTCQGRGQIAECNQNFDRRNNRNVIRCAKSGIGGSIHVSSTNANGENKIRDSNDKILDAVNIQGRALFWQCNAAAEIHAENDSALAARCDGEPNRVEQGVINVLRHQNHKENVGAIPVAKVGPKHLIRSNGGSAVGGVSEARTRRSSKHHLGENGSGKS